MSLYSLRDTEKMQYYNMSNPNSCPKEIHLSYLKKFSDSFSVYPHYGR